VAACPLGAITPEAAGKMVLDRRRCDACGKCAEVCIQEALKLVGRDMTVEQVLKEIEKDRPFYRRSGGGVTIGGGEPLTQSRFTAELLEAAQEEYLHTAIETSGYASWPHFENVLRHVDLLHFDLKHMDPEQHQALTGQSNELILENLRRIRDLKAPEDIVIRIPVIPGCNDSIANITASAEFVAGLGFSQLELVPYHRFGVSKYEQYGSTYALDAPESVSDTDIRVFRSIVESFGLREISGGL
jgi:pyruvate formate lyase activating enzyme